MQVVSSKKLKKIFFPSALFTLFKDQRKQRLEVQHPRGRAGVWAAPALPSLAQGSLWLAEERAQCAPWVFQVLLEGSRRAGWGQNGCGRARVCGASQGALHP